VAIEGVVPNPLEALQGCGFGPRCPKALEICKREAPVLQELTLGHRVACWLARGE